MSPTQWRAFVQRIKPWQAAFTAGVVVLVALRLLLVSDLPLIIVYSPHDDSMYVARAYHLLLGEAFGPYDSTVLVKYPGLSLWLAAMRTAAIPYLASVHALQTLAGLYMVAALLRCGINRWVVLGAFAFYLLNPVAFDEEWFRVLREPLSVSLFVALLAGGVHMAKSLAEGRWPWGHAVLFAAVLAFSLFLREDDRLLWGLLTLVGVALAWQCVATERRASALVFVVVFLCGAGALAKAYEFSLREYYARHYGLPILHELGEGEFPRFFAAARSIRSAKDNRMVAISNQTLENLYREVPLLRPVIVRLPPPGPRTYSCWYHGVCSETGSGWMALWIRDAAYRAGLTPSLVEEQNYYRTARLAIEHACASGALACAPRGAGLIPPMELRWTRGYVAEMWRLLNQLTVPEVQTARVPTQPSGTPADVIREYEATTLTVARPAGPPTRAGDLLGVARVALAGFLKWVDALLLIAAAAAVAIRLWRTDRCPLTPFAILAVVFALYSVFRVAALSYVAVYLGGFEPRMMFSLHVAGAFLALPVIWEAATCMRRRT